MKLVIKYRPVIPECALKIYDKGEWIDLASSESVTFGAPAVDENTNKVCFDVKKVRLGIAMQLPKYFEACILPRSSLYENKGLTLVNSEGIIDSSYKGNKDIWKANLKADRDATLLVGERILQFRIQLSQKAPVWVKLKWLFTSKIEFKAVSSLEGPNRGGFGSTGGYKEVK